jgi:hypothetical protein
MGVQIGLITIQGMTFATVGALHRVPLQSLIFVEVSSEHRRKSRGRHGVQSSC